MNEIFTAILNIDPIEIIEKYVPKNTEVLRHTSSAIKSIFSSTAMKWIIKTLGITYTNITNHYTLSLS